MHSHDAITSPPTNPREAFESRVFRGDDGPGLPYRLLKPLDFDPKQAYPLLLFLHGAGERGDDNAVQLFHGARNFTDLAMRRHYPAFVIFPQCPAEKRWVEVSWDEKSHTMPAEPSTPLAAVFQLVAALQNEFRIDERRIYGVGLSMGGFGIWDILQRKPELLAAAVPICGGGDPAYAAARKSTPVWAFHGEDDLTVLSDRSRAMIEALRAAGGHPVYTEYEGVGHDSWTETFNNRLVWDWLFSQHR